MGFIRVRSAEGPNAEYEVSEAAFNARPDAYVRVDAGEVPAPKPAQAEKTDKKFGKETQK